ncbi:MAG TPA: GNAT family N-acetyltransferase [Pirellulaceae bacterium]|nr:GNAT family N-acetyltransferase [Pirellulaceae bacterium]
MKIESIQICDLSPDLIARWENILNQSPELASPYFRPEYVQTIAGVRSGVEVGVLRDGNDVLGFWPFERAPGAVAKLVGSRLSDYQAVIAAADTPWTVELILRGCRLKAWEFDHQLASQTQLAPYFTSTGESRHLDLSPGYEQYVEQRKAAAKTLSETLRKFRKFQREHDVRFVWHSDDEGAFQQLLQWKSEQYVRTGLDDLFAVGWIVELIRTIWRTQQPQFAGVLSVMYANDKIAAVHFSMQSGKRLHSWFPAYDVGLSKFSPGACQLLFMAQCAAEHGIDCIDLGKGDEEYKLMFASGSVPLAEGVVETRPLSAAMRRGWRQTRDWVKQSPLERPARASLRWLRQVKQWIGSQP